MKGCWLALVTMILGLAGCTSTPKREMKQTQVEEFSIPPAKYDNPPEYPKDDRGFAPKISGQPFNMSGVGQGGGSGGPGGSGGLPGGPSSGMSAPRR
ncbi:hypothetical protein [Zavarzinella formosa]|uniref:hypothetical protein n=1 Tax=Zavarzinella formosa TaxID=360055 RepID=UPI0002F88FDD|nr:hypothetical protein [Zavarzinella formosa]